jgi:hypothetical protein
MKVGCRRFMERVNQPAKHVSDYLDILEKKLDQGIRIEKKYDISKRLYKWRVGPEKWYKMHEPLKIRLSNPTRDALKYGPPKKGPGGMRIYKIR